jgi:deoxyribose-phosphate aldolase
MKLSARDVARLIDISAVRTPHGECEIREMVANAKDYRFIAVHALPCWVSFLRELLAGETDIMIGAPVGFPSGAHKTDVKIAEAKALIADGVQEMDMMINVGMLRSGRFGLVQEDIRAVVAAAGPMPVKVIIEAPYLNEDEIKKACEMCIAGGAAFVKTSTGWVPNGSSLEMIRLITSFVGGAIKVKAAGAVRDLDTVVRMLRMGVARFGINMNSAMDIVRQVAALPGGTLEV